MISHLVILLNLVSLGYSEDAVTSDNHTNLVVGLMLNKVGLHPLDKYHFKPAIDIAFDTVHQRIQDGTYLNFSLSYVFRYV